jgi:hypothetical protein
MLKEKFYKVGEKVRVLDASDFRKEVIKVGDIATVKTKPFTTWGIKWQGVEFVVNGESLIQTIVGDDDSVELVKETK